MEMEIEAEHLERLRGGDREAYRYLVDRYRDMAYTLAFSILKQETEAEDAAQEGFISAYRNLDRFRGEAKFSTWLYTIVYRIALKSRQRRRRFEPLPELNQPEDSAPDQYEKLTAADQHRYLKMAIARLPDVEAAIVTLYYLDENSVTEVAKVTGLTTENVKIKLFRSRKKLRRMLSPIIQDL